MSKPEKSQSAEIPTNQPNKAPVEGPERQMLDKLMQQAGLKAIVVLTPAQEALVLAALREIGPAGIKNIEKNVVLQRVAREAIITLSKKTPEINDPDVSTVDKIIIAAARSMPMPTKNYPSKVYYWGMTLNKTSERELKYSIGLDDKASIGVENYTKIKDDTGVDSFLHGDLAVRKKIDNLPGINERVVKLGLEKYFTLDKDAIRENIDDVAKGAMLADVLLLQKEHSHLQQFDKLALIQATAKMVQEVHKKADGGIGELLVQDVVVSKKDDGTLLVRLALPDAVYVEKDPTTQKAFDVLDMCFSLCGNGWRVGGGPEAIKNMKAFIDAYGDAGVKLRAKGLAEKGVPYFTDHNLKRLGFYRTENTRVEDEAHFKKAREMLMGLL